MPKIRAAEAGTPISINALAAVQGDHVPGLDGLTGPHQQAGVVAVQGQQAVLVANGHIVAVAGVVYSLIKYGCPATGEGGAVFEGADVPYVGADGFCSPVGSGWRNIVTSFSWPMVT